MPYAIKRGKGKRPFQIINKTTGKIVGTSMTMKDAKGSIGHRMDAEMKDSGKKKMMMTNKNMKGRMMKKRKR